MLLSVAEFAARIGFRPATVRAHCEDGTIKAFKMFGRWRIEASELDRLMCRQKPRRDAAAARAAMARVGLTGPSVVSQLESQNRTA